MNAFSATALRLALLAALVLPPLLFHPRIEHAFWAFESASSRLLACLAFFFTFLEGFSAAEARKIPSTGRWIGAALFAWMLVSAVFSFRPDLGLNAWIEFLSYPMIFAAALRLCRDPGQRGRILSAVLLAGSVLAVYGLLQAGGLEVFPFNTGFNRRASSFLGNPDFLGGHLAMLLPMCLGLFLSSFFTGDQPVQAGLRSGIPGFLFALFFLCLLATATRGAILGSGVGLLVFAALNLGAFHILIKWKPWAGLGLAICLAGLCGLVFLQNPGSWQRLWTSAESRDSSASQRGVLFQNSLALAGRHPVLGVGPGNFRVFYPSVQAPQPGEGAASRPYVYTEHSHNDFIQMAAEAGFPAALLLAALWIWFYAALWKIFPRAALETDRGRYLQASGLACGLLALNVHSLFNFPFLILPTQMTAWALAAVAFSLKAGEGNSLEEDGAEKPSIIKVLVVGLGLLFLAGLAIRPLFPDALWWVGKGLQSPQNNFRWSASKTMLAKAVDLASREDRLWYLLGQAQINLKDESQASSCFSRAVELNPFYSEARLVLGKTCLNLGKKEEAEKALAPLEDYAPNFMEFWEPLAAARFQQRKFEAALATYEKALALAPSSGVLLENKAACLGSLGRFEEALSVLDEVLQLDSLSANAYLSKGITYIKMGRKKEAREALKKVLDLRPEDEYAKKLIKNLK